jgi:tetrapyrrole methylase family protein / MazG family protein
VTGVTGDTLTVASSGPHITVVGLGPAGPDLIGGATRAILEAPGAHVFLRTARHPAAAEFAARAARAFDDLYETAATFDDVYRGIVDVLVDAAEGTSDPVVYAVPGSPLVAERTVELLRRDGRASVTIVPALSFLDLAWAALAVDPLATGVRLVDAAEFAERADLTCGPVLVAQCWSRRVLSEVKLALADDVADEVRPVLLHHLGLEDEVVVEVDWWELDRALETDHLTSVWVPALPAATTPDGSDRAGKHARVGAEMARLAGLMDSLRERCPWDRAQTHASLMPHLVEECYEVLDALAGLTPDDGNSGFAHLEEELGDLLFQIVFHARLADEEGAFDLADVARRVHDKLVHRHPHVFGDVDATSPEQVVTNWEAIKKDEKGRASVTDGIPAALPALMLTTKLARKARAVGIAPDRAAAELSAALAAFEERAAARTAEGAPGPDDPLSADDPEVERAVGDVLLAVAALAQRVGVDPEQALRSRALALRAEIRAAEGVPDQD